MWRPYIGCSGFLPLLIVNASVVTPLPSNGVLMGPNGLPDWLCNYLECLLMDRIEWPHVPIRSGRSFTSSV